MEDIKQTIKEDKVNLLLLRKEEKVKWDPHNKMFKESTGSFKKATDFTNTTEILLGQLIFDVVKANDEKNSVERLQKSIEVR